MIRFFRRHPLILIGVGAALFAALLYWPAIRLPLIFDDLLHIRLAKDLDFFKVWLPSTDFGFFRPFVFLPFLLIKPLFGYYPPALLHGFNLIQQAINVFLITQLAWRLWRSWSRSLTAGALLACYPFAYQAIAHSGSLTHPFSTGLVLLALHTYLFAVEPRASRKWWILTAALFTIGLLTHESVVLFGPLAALVHWVRQDKMPWPNGDWHRRSSDFFKSILNQGLPFIWQRAPFLLFILAGGLYAVAYQLLPKGASPQVDVGGNEPLPKLLYLLQSVSYPFSWFAHILPDLSATTIVFGGLGLTAALSIWAAKKKENRLSLLLGWAWWGLASLLLGLNLPTYYILHGPRLLYLGSIGVILLWSVLLGRLFELPRLGRWLWAFSLLFIVGTSSIFVRGRLAAFIDVGGPVEIIEEALASRPVDEGVLLVNLPEWTSPARNTYAAGVEYVTLMGTHLFAEELVGENLGEYRPVLAIDLPDLLTDSGYPYGVHSQASLEIIKSDWAPAGSHVFISSYSEAGITTEYTGQFTPASPSPTLAAFNSYRLQDAQANVCENTVQVTLTWDLSSTGNSLDSAATRNTMSTFVQLLDEGGRLIGQLDGPPLRLRADLVQLLPGWQMVDRRTLSLDGEGHPEQLLVGIYDFVTGERQPAVDGDDIPLPDNAYRFPVSGACAIPETGQTR